MFSLVYCVEVLEITWCVVSHLSRHTYIFKYKIHFTLKEREIRDKERDRERDIKVGERIERD